jgi:hypothetical protein
MKGATLEPMGVEDRAQTTLSFDPGTRTVTITPTGASWAYWWKGQRVVVSTPKSVTFADTQGTWYVYFENATPTLIASQTPWDISSTVQIAAVLWDSTDDKGVLVEERHGVSMDWATHLNLHSTQGTKVVSGFAMTGYTLNSDTDADISPDIASGVLADEDLRTTVAALVAGTNAYRVYHRRGAAGDWTYTQASVPFLNTAAGYVNYNQFTGGVWQQTQLAANQYVNMWLIAIPAAVNGEGFGWVMGQKVHASLASAIQESINEVQFGTIPFTEMAALYQVTFRTSNGYASTGKARIESVIKIVGSLVTIAQSGGAAWHPSLGGLAEPSQHPSSSISVDSAAFSGSLSAADDTVQKALATLDAHTGAVGTMVYKGDYMPNAYVVGDSVRYGGDFWVCIQDVAAGASAPVAPYWEKAVDVPEIVAMALDDLTDVNAPAPTDEQALLWDSATSKWVAGTVTTTPPDLTPYALKSGTTFTGTVTAPGLAPDAGASVRNTYFLTAPPDAALGSDGDIAIVVA